MRTTLNGAGTDQVGTTRPAPVVPPTDLYEVTHRFCTTCNDSRAMCGFDTNGCELEDADGTEAPCPICETILLQPCTWCGDL